MRAAEPDDLRALQATLAGLLRAADPSAALAAALARPDADPRLAAIDADGLRIAALLVAKLRFQRLLNASPAAVEWFEHDGREFTAAFRAYHTTVPATALDPWGEADAFARWCAEGSESGA
jgi:hypothetical protein